jgi:hypothetical protein
MRRCPRLLPAPAGLASGCPGPQSWCMFGELRPLRHSPSFSSTGTCSASTPRTAGWACFGGSFLSVATSAPRLPRASGSIETSTMASSLSSDSEPPPLRKEGPCGRSRRLGATAGTGTTTGRGAPGSGCPRSRRRASASRPAKVISNCRAGGTGVVWAQLIVAKGPRRASLQLGGLPSAPEPAGGSAGLGN